MGAVLNREGKTLDTLFAFEHGEMTRAKISWFSISLMLNWN
jgi:hypothetical protein